MIRLLIPLVLLLQISGFSVQAKPLTIVADEWPPFSGHSLLEKGLSLDLIRHVLERAGYESRTSVEPWARIMEGARNGRYDIIGSLFETDDLKGHMTYSDAYFETRVRFLQARGQDFSYQSLDDLKPYSIAVGDGFLYAEEFDAADYLNKVVLTTTLQCVQMVAHGRVNLTLDSEEVIQYALAKEAPELKEKVEFLATPLAIRGIHMAVRNDLENHDEIIAAFNKALAAMQADGSYDAIINRHMKQLR